MSRPLLGNILSNRSIFEQAIEHIKTGSAEEVDEAVLHLTDLFLAYSMREDVVQSVLAADSEKDMDIRGLSKELREAYEQIELLQEASVKPIAPIVSAGNCVADTCLSTAAELEAYHPGKVNAAVDACLAWYQCLRSFDDRVGMPTRSELLERARPPALLVFQFAREREQSQERFLAITISLTLAGVVAGWIMKSLGG